MGAYVPKIESPVTGEPEPAAHDGLDGPPGRGEHQTLQRVVQGRQQGAARLLLGHLPGLDHRRSRCSPSRRCTARTSPRRPTSTSSRARARSSRTSSRRGSGRSSGSSARSRSCSSRWASSTTSRVSAPTCSRRCTCATTSAGASPRSTRASCGRCACSASPSWPSGFDQPLVLLVLSACLNGIVMFIYSILLIKLNRTGLPPAIRIRGMRLGVLAVRRAVLRLLRGLVRDRPDGGDLLMRARRDSSPASSCSPPRSRVLYVAAALLGLLGS